MSERALHSIHSAKNISIFLTYSGKWKSAQKTQKTQGRCGASYKFADGGSHMSQKNGRGYFADRTNSFPEWRENPRNKESRNE
jgi:hypothetical protein